MPFAPAAPTLPPFGARAIGNPRVGVIHNGLAHLNRTMATPGALLTPDILTAAPMSQGELHETLGHYARARVDTLVVSGGDGTVRDVLTAAAAQFGDRMPRIALVPSGKTNAIALDVGLPKRWRLNDAMHAAQTGRIVRRHPLVIERADGRAPAIHGFLFGAGAFVRATALAQGTHRIGAFNGLAVGLSLTGAIGQTLFGGRHNVWRQGEHVSLTTDQGQVIDRQVYILLATTLTRLPLDIRVFGRPRAGMKLLCVDAPPRRMALTLPALLSGSQAPWLSTNGYHHSDPTELRLRLDSPFILDGDIYDGGELIVRRGPAVDFVLPG